MSVRRLGVVAALWGLWGLLMSATPAIANGWPDILLFWTSPTDNGSRGGAVAYDMRWATVPITEQNFQLCPKLAAPPVPYGPGSLQIYAVKGFDPMGIYFFALKSVDDQGNWSQLSNVVIHTPDENPPRKNSSDICSRHGRIPHAVPRASHSRWPSQAG
jgi:hypothetical protein